MINLNDFSYLKKSKVIRKNASYYTVCSYCNYENELLYKGDRVCICKNCNKFYYTSKAKEAIYNFEDIMIDNAVYRIYYNYQKNKVEKYLIMYNDDNWNVYSKITTLMSGGFSQHLKPKFTKIGKNTKQMQHFELKLFVESFEEIQKNFESDIKKYNNPLLYELKKRVGVREFNKIGHTELEKYKSFNKRHKNMIKYADDITSLYDYLIVLNLMKFKRNQKWLYHNKYRKLHIYLSRLYKNEKSKKKAVRYEVVTRESRNYKYAKVVRTLDELIEQGKKYNHCVSSYDKRVINRECLIYEFNDGQEQGTLEVRDGKVVQARKHRNEDILPYLRNKFKSLKLEEWSR